MASRLSEVARLSGRSEVTVSRLLNGRTRPTTTTLAAVLTALDVLGYERPARLRVAPAGLVGLVLPDLRNPTFPAFAEALTVALLRHGYTAALCTRTADGVSEAEYIDMLLAHDTAGVVFVGGSFADVGARPGRALRRRRIPAVLINGADENPGRARVRVDDGFAVRLALRHLAALGHRRIGLVLGPGGHVPSDRKLAAFRAYAPAGTEAPVVRALFSMEGGQAATARMLATGVTALICASDFLALGAVRAARRQGLSVPADLSVVGFDDSLFMRDTDPPLTTLRQPVRPMARAAVDALVGLIEGAPPTDEEALFDPELIVRGSTGPVPADRD